MTESRIESLLAAWGIAGLKPLQALVIGQIMEAANPGGEAARRRLVVLPTGYGKTLCFAVPAALLPCPTLVIYPLRALMADQARRFESLGLPACQLLGGLGRDELAARLRGIAEGRYRIILANPEILQSAPVAAALGRLEFSHVAIDEAHVVGHWGSTFRPAYNQLAAWLQRIKAGQVSAFTATADADARNAIRELLGDCRQDLFTGPVDRPEIHYRVIRTRQPELSLHSLLLGAGRIGGTAAIGFPAVVFIRNRSLCEQLSLRCRHLDAGRQGMVRFYHAGLSRAERLHLEHWFFHSRNGVLVTTNAYGLGVDKPDIRTVIHYGPPDSAAAYLQESGRAARDGRPAKAICLVQDDLPAPMDPLMARFLAGRECRRIPLLEAVQDTCGICAGCDVCAAEAADWPFEVGLIREFIRKRQGELTLAETGKAIRQAGLLDGLGRIQVETMLHAGLGAGWLRKSRSPFSWHRLVVTGPEVGKDQETVKGRLPGG
jgi:ATP-dependent DNA helicase RecQ